MLDSFCGSSKSYFIMFKHRNITNAKKHWVLKTHWTVCPRVWTCFECESLFLWCVFVFHVAGGGHRNGPISSCCIVARHFYGCVWTRFDGWLAGRGAWVSRWVFECHVASLHACVLVGILGVIMVPRWRAPLFPQFSISLSLSFTLPFFPFCFSLGLETLLHFRPPWGQKFDM